MSAASRSEARQPRLPRVLAGLVALAVWVVGFVGSYVFFLSHAVLPSYVMGPDDLNEVLELAETPIRHVSMFFALAPAAFLYCLSRGRLSQETVFQSFFLGGFTLLCFCCWEVWIAMPIRNNRALTEDWSNSNLNELFTAPLLCLVFVPTAVLLTGFATLYDNSRRR